MCQKQVRHALRPDSRPAHLQPPFRQSIASPLALSEHVHLTEPVNLLALTHFSSSREAAAHESLAMRAGGPFAMMRFESLCGQPVAAADYIALAEQFHTIAVEDFPVFTAATRPQAYRCVTLVDVLYEHRIRLFASSEAVPMDLFKHVVTQADAQAKVGPAGKQLCALVT